MKSGRCLFSNVFIFSLFAFAFVLYFAGNAQALALTNSITLTTSVSNTTLTFNAFNVSVDSVIIEASNITLVNITCDAIRSNSTYETLFFNETHTITDSGAYCAAFVEPEQPSANGGASGGSGGGGGGGSRPRPVPHANTTVNTTIPVPEVVSTSENTTEETTSGEALPASLWDVVSPRLVAWIILTVLTGVVVIVHYAIQIKKPVRFK